MFWHNEGNFRSEAAQPAVPRGLPWWAVWVCVLVVHVLVTRFFNLADKPLHHDESMFAYYGFQLYRGAGYAYLPILHGPVLQNLSAFFFLLFGTSDFVMRLPAALGGVALVALAWQWRRLIGVPAALVAVALMAMSPSLTYYSRFLRNDVPYLAATVACAFYLLQAVRYGQGRHWAAAIAFAVLMFSMMESSIFFFTACLGYLGVVLITDWLFATKRDDATSTARRFPGSMPIFSAGPPPRSDATGILISFLCVVTVAAAAAGAATYVILRIWEHAIPLPRILAGVPRDGTLAPGVEHTMKWVIFGGFAVVFLPIFAAIADQFRTPRGRFGALHYFTQNLWRNRYVVAATVLLGIAFYTTIFTTWFTHTADKDYANLYGGEATTRALTPLQIYKNTWDYWWDQHSLHRIKGDFHYYLPILFLYELPAMLAVLCGLVIGWLRSGARRVGWLTLLMVVPQLSLGAFLWWAGSREPSLLNWAWLDDHVHVQGPFHVHLALFYVQLLTVATGALYLRRRFVQSFLLFWTVQTLFAYSYAGEKVPWLAIHTAAPAALLAGTFVADAFGWFRRTQVRRVFATALAVVAALWMVRQQVFVAFIHPHSPAERIVFNHTHTDVEFAVRKVNELAHVSGLGNKLPILLLGEVQWPMFWYLRDYESALATSTETADTTSRPVVIMDYDAAAQSANLTENYDIYKLKVREWWEPPMLDLGLMARVWMLMIPRDTAENTPSILAEQELIAVEWKKLWHCIAYRQIFLDPNNPTFSYMGNMFALCVRKDLFETYRSVPWQDSLPSARRDISVYPKDIYP